MIKGFVGEYRWLSNFWYSDIRVNGLLYPTVEHFYQSRKSIHIDEQEEIRLCGCPSKARYLGRRVVEIDPAFKRNRIYIMRTGIEAKFDQNEELRNKLIRTGDRDLEEANTWGDKFWGTVDGSGQNNLGKLLMECRSGHILEQQFYGNKNYT